MCDKAYFLWNIVNIEPISQYIKNIDFNKLCLLQKSENVVYIPEHSKHHFLVFIPSQAVQF